MFSFTKFYNGHRAVEISNIDHDHVIELFFETLADLKSDSNWSFSVKPF